MKIFLSLFFLIAFTEAFGVDRDYGLCSQVFQMHQYCSGFTNSTIPVGPQGPPGPPGEVDYVSIKAVIDMRMAVIKREFSEKLKALEARLEKALQERASDNKTNCLEEPFSDCDSAAKCATKPINGTGDVFDLMVGDTPAKGYCDLTTDGGNWLVFQRRRDGSVEFERGWDEFVNGFGNPDEEFWFGLERLHQLTKEKQYELRIDLEDFDGNERYAVYSTFRVGDSQSNYRLTIGGYSGDAGDSMIQVSNGMEFTTTDNDNDQYSAGNCADLFKGAWWHKTCHEANLNGKYLRGSHSSYADGIEWNSWTGYYYSLKFSEMKMRPIEQ